MILEITGEEFASRRNQVIERLQEDKFQAFCFFNATSIFYLTGFYFIPTERPLAYILTADGCSVMMVPRLEVEHAESLPEVEIKSYPEYPGETHPMEALRDIFQDMGLRAGRLVVDSDGYASAMGYRGPRLSDLLPEALVRVDRYMIEDMRKVKSPGELAMITESCRWGNLAHELLQEYAAVGRSELEITMSASTDATLMMMRALGRSYRPVGGGTGARAGFRGQIGANSALPHAVTTNARLKEGDVLVTGAASTVFGYTSELERTMFVGAPSREQRKWFDLMCRAQEVAFSAIRPGRKCSDVEAEVQRFYREEGLNEYWRHHTGHALGLLGHEAPFFDRGDDTVLEPGMVFSVEPGIYVMGLGGFRHSDTLAVTDDGVEMLTYYPRDWESLVV